MSGYQIYHNPRCTKSRQTLALLEENGIQPEIILYLDTPPTREELQAILKKLNMSARQLLRQNEDEATLLGLNNEAVSEDDIINAMMTCPKLIERPIVIKGNKAVIGRPPENVLVLL